MATRLFHTIVICGAALASLPLACGGEADEDKETDKLAQRCKLSDGGCDERCTLLPDERCIDPCFVHTESCSPDCVQPDGSCGWPPTK